MAMSNVSYTPDRKSTYACMCVYALACSLHLMCSLTRARRFVEVRNWDNEDLVGYLKFLNVSDAVITAFHGKTNKTRQGKTGRDKREKRRAVSLRPQNKREREQHSL